MEVTSDWDKPLSVYLAICPQIVKSSIYPLNEDTLPWKPPRYNGKLFWFTLTFTLKVLFPSWNDWDTPSRYAVSIPLLTITVTWYQLFGGTFPKNALL